ncbi:hypothetical protein PVAP13_3KG202000 [Panicum virgatum]|uniref:Uncharacterized protein n=1 Tax=Panicum virgatum TaxID=38727 RepID=A0A8T0USD5_PANVG|nr:hypothetical protein PVAP13_3KG202000 [Panicum virgatum]
MKYRPPPRPRPGFAPRLARARRRVPTADFSRRPTSMAEAVAPATGIVKRCRNWPPARTTTAPCVARMRPRRRRPAPRVRAQRRSRRHGADADVEALETTILRSKVLDQAQPLGVGVGLGRRVIHHPEETITRGAEDHHTGPSVLAWASAAAAVDPPGCLSEDAAAGLPASSSTSSVAAIELRRSPSPRDAPDLRLPTRSPATTKSDRDLIKSGPHM